MVAAGGSGGAAGNSNSDSGRAGGGLYGTVGSSNGEVSKNISYGTQSLKGMNISISSASGGFGSGGHANNGAYNGAEEEVDGMAELVGLLLTGAMLVRVVLHIYQVMKGVILY